MPAPIKLMNAPKDPAASRAVLTRMEMAFGHDLSQVKPQGSASPASARAYVTGRDVFFAPGDYAPGSPGGEHLSAHEAAHVVQQ